MANCQCTTCLETTEVKLERAYRKIDECYGEIKKLEDIIRRSQTDLIRCKGDRNYWYDQHWEARRDLRRREVMIRELEDKVKQLQTELIIRKDDRDHWYDQYWDNIYNQEVMIQELEKEMAERLKAETLQLWKENRKLRAQYTVYKEAVFAVMYGGS